MRHQPGVSKIRCDFEMTPPGIRGEVDDPALRSSDCVLAGILKATQCHQPEPVGASGSYMVTAKLRVPAGDGSIAIGDWICQHPKPRSVERAFGRAGYRAVMRNLQPLPGCARAQCDRNTQWIDAI